MYMLFLTLTNVAIKVAAMEDRGSWMPCEECGYKMYFTFGQQDSLGYDYFNSGCFLCHACDEADMANYQDDPPMWENPDSDYEPF